MKIAMMVRAYLVSPVSKDIAYSPTGVAVAIAEGLAKRGHEVTFFGPEGTHLATNVETCNIRPLATSASELFDLVSTTDLFRDYLPSLYDQYMVKSMFERARAGEFDVLFFHHPESAAPFARLFPDVPVVYTVHDYLDSTRRQVFEMHSSPNQHYVSISNSQRRDAPDFNYAATVYNGIDIEKFVFHDSHEDYLMFAGRIIPEKGLREAVQVALQTGKRLIITGSTLPTSQWYFDEYVKPYLSDKILYLGMIDHAQMVKYYQKALALLVPIQWEEPFGLTMAEANACGTPVIAFRRGSVPEVVDDGKTGFIVDNTSAMIEAVGKLSKINRKDCRKHVEERFTLDHMINGYEKVLRSIVTPPKPKTDTKKIIRSLKLLSDKLLINSPK
ncbi:MAG: glycosyltransferase family 4 protein [Candidatus Saccharibacteria bacterium]|nr:MAG: glycosyltransferase family 4 protein [Candidatus Saccharibacteria bacterium]